MLKIETWNWHISAHIPLAEESHMAKPKDKGCEVCSTHEEVLVRVWMWGW